MMSGTERLTSADRYCGCPGCQAIYRLPDEKFNHRACLVRCGACDQVFDASRALVQKTENGFELVPTDSRPENQGATKITGSAHGNDDKNAEFRSPNTIPVSRQAPSCPAHEGRANSISTGLDNGENASRQAGLTEWDRPDREDAIKNPFEDRIPENLGESRKYADSSVLTDPDEPVIEPLDFDPGQSIHISIKGRDEEQSSMDCSDPDWLSGPMPQEFHPSCSLLNDEKYDSMDMEYPAVRDSDSPNVSTGLPSAHAVLERISRNGVDEYIRERPNPLLSVIWFVVVSGFVLLLGMQVKYFLVDRYAQDETYRKYLIGFCKIVQCELPPRQDPFRFTLTHTGIDLHPTRPGALRISVKLVNEAKFPQPYPLLQLTLADKVGRVVGRRTFSPGVYLPDGVPNMIGGGEPGSILFDLARPHEKAVGFVVDIVTAPVSS